MILSISDTEKKCQEMKKTGFIYLLIALSCILFGAIYESCSHGVYSGYMIYAFVFPLAGGTLPFYALSFSQRRFFPERLSLNLYHSGITALTVGSIFQGVLEIYGTTNRLVRVYDILGIFFVCAGLLSYLIMMYRSKSFPLS